MISIKLDKVSKRFGYRYIFKNLNYEFTDGVYGISGQNGSGKSTVLKVISGFMSHSEGTLAYHIDNLEIKRAVIFQKLSLAAPYVNLIDEFTLPEIFQFHKTHRSLYCDTYHQFINILNYPYRPDVFWKEYSSGMQQRVKLCLAMLSKSRIVVLDEPTSFLDDKGITWFYDLLNLHVENKIILIGSNDQRDFSFCNAIINIEDYHA